MLLDFYYIRMKPSITSSGSNQSLIGLDIHTDITKSLSVEKIFNF